MKKTLLEIAYEMATDLYDVGVIDAAAMLEYESVLRNGVPCSALMAEIIAEL